MPKNLKYKIGFLIDDLETLSKPDAIRILEGFIKEELKFMEAEYEFDVRALYQIKSSAIQLLSESKVHIGLYGSSEDSEQRTLAYFTAVIGYLRSKELIAFSMKFKNK